MWYSCREKGGDLDKEGKVKFADDSSNSSYEDAIDRKFSEGNTDTESKHNKNVIQSYLDRLSNGCRASSEPIPEKSTFVRMSFAVFPLFL